ncbi:MAG: RES family NAD+ phosphorylase [Coriobacteriia bacterium]
MDYPRRQSRRTPCRVTRDIYPPLGSNGARLFGGRFNPPGVPALYLAQDADLAMRESTRSAELAGLTLLAPRRIVCVRLVLQFVVLLDDPETVAVLGLSEEDLLAPWPAPKDELTACQLLGERLFLAGVEGIRYPSAIDRTRVNYAVFRDNLRLGGSVLDLVTQDA